MVKEYSEVSFMGLLNGNKSEAQKIEEERIKILNEGQVFIHLAVGTHGADEIVAGAMMGETGKYLAMAKYGKTKWEPTYLLISNEGIQVDYTCAFYYYNEINSIKETHSGWLDTEFILNTTKGRISFKLYGPTFKALKIIISDLKEKYLAQLEQEKINHEQKESHQESEQKVDRLIELGKMYENGLLSEEEFASMKQDILKGNENNKSDNENSNFHMNSTNPHENTKRVCENCGEEVLEDANFCTNCGNKL